MAIISSRVFPALLPITANNIVSPPCIKCFSTIYFQKFVYYSMRHSSPPSLLATFLRTSLKYIIVNRYTSEVGEQERSCVHLEEKVKPSAGTVSVISQDWLCRTRYKVTRWFPRHTQARFQNGFFLVSLFRIGRA